jgi:acyl-CoA reductase-like NAD-dependent aldehyde dehydrogenase
VVVAKSPIQKIAEVARSRGWNNLRLLSSASNTFNRDYFGEREDGSQPGTVWVNCHHLIDPAPPFGGFKQSGIGREQAADGIELYTETKSVLMRI